MVPGQHLPSGTAVKTQWSLRCWSGIWGLGPPQGSWARHSPPHLPCLGFLMSCLLWAPASPWPGAEDAAVRVCQRLPPQGLGTLAMSTLCPLAATALNLGSVNGPLSFHLALVAMSVCVV